MKREEIDADSLLEETLTETKNAAEIIARLIETGILTADKGHDSLQERAYLDEAQRDDSLVLEWEEKSDKTGFYYSFLMKRHATGGFWQGFIQLPLEHAYDGMTVDDLSKEFESLHGQGLAYSDYCQAEENEPWTLGIEMNSKEDYIPGKLFRDQHDNLEKNSSSLRIYRNYAFVREQLRKIFDICDGTYKQQPSLL